MDRQHYLYTKYKHFGSKAKGHSNGHVTAQIPAREHHVNVNASLRPGHILGSISVCACTEMSRLVIFCALFMCLCGVCVCLTVNEECRKRLTKLDAHMNAYVGYV